MSAKSPLAPTRRSFLVASGLTALASSRAYAANETLRLGIIGNGGRMGSLIDSADRVAPVQFAAVADVYKPNRDKLVARSGGQATSHLDYREVLDDKEIDAVLIASPDHWHVKMATDALAAGKDVYLEKPVTHTIDEGIALTKAVRASKQILQCGMQQRSWAHFHNAVNLIQGGGLGRVLQARLYWWQNYQSRYSKEPSWTSADRPVDVANLDWKLWLGVDRKLAPDQEFSKEKFFHWRWFWNFGGGAMTDLFTHWIDVVHWAMQSDTPSAAQMLADKYYFEAWDCPDTVQAALRYPGPQNGIFAGKGFDVVYEGMMASSIDDGGLEFRGTDATLKLSRSGMSIHHENLSGKENPILTESSFQDGTVAHMQNFFDCIKSRKEPNAPVEAGVAAARAGHIANLAYRGTGQIHWPPK
jgi:predicted dehydrogenase